MGLRRGQLATWWVGFIVLWCFSAFVTLFVNFLACLMENSGIREGSLKHSYCQIVPDFLESGEPSELTTPLPYLAPLVVLAAVGGFGVWLGSRTFLRWAAIVALGALVVHIVLVVVLPG